MEGGDDPMTVVPDLPADMTFAQAYAYVMAANNGKTITDAKFSSTMYLEADSTPDTTGGYFINAGYTATANPVLAVSAPNYQTSYVNLNPASYDVAVFSIDVYLTYIGGWPQNY